MRVRGAGAARWLLAGSALVTLVLYQVPGGARVVYPLLLLSTVVHELGHGLTAVLVGGDFLGFRMSADGAGVAFHTGTAGAARGLVAAGGLCGPAITAAVMLAIAPRRRAARWALGGFGAGLALVTAIYVRGGFGVGFCAAVAAAALAIAALTRPRTAQLALVVLAVQLGLSVYARRDYLFAATAGGLPSDSAQMARAFGGSPAQWGAACAAFSVAVLALGVVVFLRGDARAAQGPDTDG